MRKLFAFILFTSFSLACHVYSQGLITTIVGEVYDANTREPIEAVNVYIKGTSVGTATTAEGIFLLRFELSRKAVMVVSAVGYEKQQFDVSPGMSAGIDVALKESNHAIEDVFVLPGSNPALALLDSVRRYRQANRKSADYGAGSNSIDVGVSRFSTKQLKRRIWKSMQGAMRYTADSSLVLPLYSRFSERGMTEEKVQMLSDSQWKILLAGFDTPPNFYSNSITYLNVSFLSPLAGDGNHYYKYFLVDSVREGDSKSYKVRFYTKNPYYPTFNGEMLIDSATYGLSYIKADVPREVNVNYLEGLTIEQHFAKAESGRYVPDKEEITMLLDFDVKTGKADIFPSLLISSVSVFDMEGQEEPEKNKGPAYDAGGLSAADTLQTDMPLMRVATFAAQVIQTAYIPTGTMVEIGRVPEILHVNPIETVRLGLPLRTNARFSKRVCLEGYAAYGFGDKEWKGGGKVQLLLPTKRRSILALGYDDSYVRSDMDEMMRLKRENSMWFSDMGITMHIMRMFMQESNFSATMLRRRELSLIADCDWSDNVETRFSVAAGGCGYRYSKASAMVRVGWQEKKVDMHFQRVYVYSDKPTLYFYGEMGSIRHYNEDNYSMYGKLSGDRQRAEEYAAYL